MSNSKKLNRLRAWREREGLTQAQVAAEIGVSTPLYKLVESGRYDVTERIASLLQSYFGEPAERLLAPVPVRQLPKPVVRAVGAKAVLP